MNKTRLRKKRIDTIREKYCMEHNRCGAINNTQIIDEKASSLFRQENELNTEAIETRNQINQVCISGFHTGNELLFLKPGSNKSLHEINQLQSSDLLYLSLLHNMEINNNQHQKNESKEIPMEIYSIMDTSTCRTDGYITKGRNVEIKGSCIKVTTEFNDCGIYFFNKNTNRKTKTLSTDIVINDPSRLLIFVPQNLEKGEYELVICSRFSGTQHKLDRTRSVNFDITLTID